MPFTAKNVLEFERIRGKGPQDSVREFVRFANFHAGMRSCRRKKMTSQMMLRAGNLIKGILSNIKNYLYKAFEKLRLSDDIVRIGKNRIVKLVKNLALLFTFCATQSDDDSAMAAYQTYKKIFRVTPEFVEKKWDQAKKMNSNTGVLNTFMFSAIDFVRKYLQTEIVYALCPAIRWLVTSSDEMFSFTNKENTNSTNSTNTTFQPPDFTNITPLNATSQYYFQPR